MKWHIATASTCQELPVLATIDFKQDFTFSKMLNYTN